MMLLVLALIAGTPLTPENFQDVRDISISCYLRASDIPVLLPDNPEATTSGKLVRIYLPEAIVVRALRSDQRVRAKSLKNSLIIDPENALGWQQIYRLQITKEVPGLIISRSPGPVWKNKFQLIFEKTVGWIAITKPTLLRFERSHETGQVGQGCSVTSGRAPWAS
jgi:hypothetical protein